jgi:hypothetical protein
MNRQEDTEKERKNVGEHFIVFVKDELSRQINSFLEKKIS